MKNECEVIKHLKIRKLHVVHITRRQLHEMLDRLVMHGKWISVNMEYGYQSILIERLPLKYIGFEKTISHTISVNAYIFRTFNLSAEIVCSSK